MKRILLAVFATIATFSSASAVEPDEMLADKALEARAREISKELRCVVCQNQSIDDSNAPLAHDMRVIVRERVTAGDSNQQVKAFLVKRYGNFVLLRPPVQKDTALLWAGPALFLGLAIIGFALYLKRSNTKEIETPDPLTHDERERLARLNDGTA